MEAGLRPRQTSRPEPRQEDQRSQTETSQDNAPGIRSFHLSPFKLPASFTKDFTPTEVEEWLLMLDRNAASRAPQRYARHHLWSEQTLPLIWLSGLSQWQMVQRTHLAFHRGSTSHPRGVYFGWANHHHHQLEFRFPSKLCRPCFEHFLQKSLCQRPQF